jgi:hypothetical protein
MGMSRHGDEMTLKACDGGWMIEIAEISQANAGRPYDANAQNAQFNQPHAPDGGRRFYLAIRGRLP